MNANGRRCRQFAKRFRHLSGIGKPKLGKPKYRSLSAAISYEKHKASTAAKIKK